MRNRLIRAAAVATSALIVLSGCVAQPSSPAPPTRAEIAAYNQARLDGTRGTQGLEGITPRLTTATVLPKSEDSWVATVMACLSDAGFHVSGFSSSTDGYSVGTSDGSATRERVALYYCIAAHPADPVTSGELYSPAQLSYLWTYFTTWQVPCLTLHGYRVSSIPSRARFFGAGGLVWTPYDAIQFPQAQPSLTEDLDRTMRQIEIMCGPKLGAVTSTG